MAQFMILLAECTLTMTVAAAILLAVTRPLEHADPKGGYIAWVVIVIGFLIPYRPHVVQPEFALTIRQLWEAMRPRQEACRPVLGGGGFSSRTA